MHVGEVFGDGSMPCQRHTTIGVSQISHSAIQHTSSSWNQWVILAASHRSQASDFSPRGIRASSRRYGRESMDPQYAGTGYLALPEGGAGPGSSCCTPGGASPTTCATCATSWPTRATSPSRPTSSSGRVATEVAEAEKQLHEADANELAHLTRSSLATLRSMAHTPDGPVGVLGWSMGASMALWLAARVPDDVAATAVYYGGQDIDMEDARCAFLGHFAETDPYVDEDGLVLLESELHLDGLEVEFHRYPGTPHWFAEPDRPEHDPHAAALAWDRTLDFFETYLPPGP